MARVQVLGEDPEDSGWWKKAGKQRERGSAEFDGNVECCCQARHPTDKKKGCNCTEIHQYKGKAPKKWMCVPCSSGTHTWANIY